MRWERSVIGVILLLGLLGCGAPAWYEAREVAGHEHLLVGYGEGESLSAARADAAREIAETLEVQVRSTGEVVTQSGPQGSDVSSRFRVALSSLATLRELVTLKLARVADRYYMALGYDNRNLLQKVEAALGQGRAGEVPLGDGFADSLPLYQELARLGLSPDEARLARRNGRWELVLLGRAIPLGAEEWFRLCFVEKPENNGLALTVTPSGPLADGSRYQVHVTPPLALGYLSLYHVSESGQTQNLISNRAVDGLAPVIFPDERLYSGLEAMATGNTLSRDMLLATWSPRPMPPMASHTPVSETALPETEEHAFSYGDLLQQVNDALWASRFVWIQRPE